MVGKRPYFQYPPSPETMRLTYAEVSECKRKRLPIHAFQLDQSQYLDEFVEKVTTETGGSRYPTTADALTPALLDHYLKVAGFAEQDSRQIIDLVTDARLTLPELPPPEEPPVNWGRPQPSAQ